MTDDPRSLLSLLTVVLLLTACTGGDPTSTAAIDGPGSSVDEPAPDAGETDDADAMDDPPADADATPDATPDDADATPDASPDADAGDTTTELVPTSLAENTQRFPLGVQAGGMRPDSALFWTKVTDTAPKTLLVWRPTDDPTRIAVAAEVVAEPADGGFIEVRAAGLDAGTWYSYAFFDGQDLSFSSRSRIGQVRTALTDGVTEPITIGATSCTKFTRAPYDALSLMATEPLDAFVHLGDMSYNDDASTLEEHRALWEQTLRDPGYAALLPSTGLYATWDDHELQNNLDPERADPVRLAGAKAAFFETLAVEPGPAGQLWSSFRWGDAVEFFVLDSRSERRPSTRGTLPEIYLSRAQLNWLVAGLKDSPAHFKVVLNSVPITRMPPLWLAQEDRWQGYPSQRDELLDFIVNEDIRNVWFLTGDFHCGFVSHVEADGPRRRIREIAVGPGANGPNPLAAGAEIGVPPRQSVFPAAQFAYGSAAIEVATFLRFDPATNSVHVRFVDAATEVALFDETLSEDD